MNSYELAHHGILGMHWGIRRTPEQLGHEPTHSKRKQASIEKRTQKRSLFRNRSSTKTSTDKEETKMSAEEKEKIIAKGDIKSASKNIDEFSNAELYQVVARYEMTTKVNKLATADIKTGQQKMQEMANKLGTAADLTSKGINLYNNVAKIVNASSDSKLPTIGGDNNDKDKKPKVTTTDVKVTTLPDGTKRTVTTIKKK